MKLVIANNLSLPLEAVTQTFADLGIRGSGKTNTAVALAEEMLKAGQQICALDPTDAWYGIRSSRDGKSEGFRVYVFGGEHGDIPLTGAAGEGSTMAEFLVESGASVVFSLRHLSIHEQRRFAQEFAERLYDLKGKAANRTPLHIFVDEADEFIPQRIPQGFERMFGAYDRLVRRGRSSGIGLTMISQRPQVINKDTLSQCEILICHRLLHKLDRKAVKEGWVEGHDIEGKIEEFMDSLASLDKGQAWFWSPSWLDVFLKVQVRWRDTFDSSFTPKAGEKPKTVSKLAEVDLDALKQKLATTIEKVKADDPKELRKKIAELERQLRSVPAQVAAPQIDVEAVAREVSAAAADERDKLWGFAVGRFKNQIVEQISEALMAIEVEKPEDFATTKILLPATLPMRTPLENRAGAHFKATPARQVVRNAESIVSGNGSISGLKERILRLLAEFEALGRQEVRRTVVSARAEARGGYFSNTLGSMRVDGLIEYPAPRMVSLTAHGRRLAPKPDTPINNREMYDSCLRNLSGLELRIFELLYKRYPNSVSRDEVSERVDARGGYFSNTIGHLHSMEFVEYPKPGFVKCPDWVFVE